MLFSLVCNWKILSKKESFMILQKHEGAEIRLLYTEPL